MMLIGQKYKPNGRYLVNKIFKMFNDILNVTFKGMITKIKDEPDTLDKYPLSVQAYYLQNKDDIEAKIKDFYDNEVKELITILIM